MSQLENSTAIKSLLFAALLLVASLSWAGQVAGTVTRLSGPLMAQKADGTAKALAIKSEVEQGDTLVTKKDTYAQIKFIDNSEITLKPNTTFKVENFAFDAGKPEEDNAAFNLVKGGLRSVTGLLGKRNKEKFALKTPGATIGIRGTTFTVDWIEAGEEAVAAMRAFNLASMASLDQAAMPLQPLILAQNGPGDGPNPGIALAAGLYVHVIDGIINLSNRGGSQSFTTGQFGFTSSTIIPPIVVPNNPGIQFHPPASFSSTTLQNNGTSSGNKSGTVDCEVR
ncbi:MAG: FecR family protein [Pseudomonadota bacterium]